MRKRPPRIHAIPAALVAGGVSDIWRTAWRLAPRPSSPRWDGPVSHLSVQRLARRGCSTMRHATKLQIIVGLAIVPLVASTLWLRAHREHLQKPMAAALYWSYLIAAFAAIGLYWWYRRPASRCGPLLVIFGLGVWVVSWQGANAPLLYDLGVLAEGPFFALTLYLFL